MSQITVIKRNHQGQEKLRYPGVVLARGPAWVCLEARFGFDDMTLEYVTLRRGDRFVEWFYSDRWYNVFKIHDVHSDKLKGWYCNITRPAEITPQIVAADDLALDLFVKPSGEWLLLDEDEFAAIPLTANERTAANDAVQRIYDLVKASRGPFRALL